MTSTIRQPDLAPSSRAPLVTFDIGGVLVRLSPNFEAAAAHAGIALTDNPREAEHDPDLSRAYYDWQIGALSDELFFDIWAACSQRFRRQEAPRMSLGWLVEEFEGVCEVVAALAQNDIETGVLSNTANHHWEHLFSKPELFPSLQYIRHPWGSHQLGAMKPDPAIYRAFEAKVGRQGADIVFFDDLAVNVDGAKALGWRAFLVRRGDSPASQISAVLREIGCLA